MCLGLAEWVFGSERSGIVSGGVGLGLAEWVSVWVWRSGFWFGSGEVG